MHDWKRKRGEWSGNVPYGWRVENKRLDPDPGQQATLTDPARRFVDGDSCRAFARACGFNSPQAPQAILSAQRTLDALPPRLGGQLAEALRDRRHRRKPTNAPSLLGGIATCGVCGRNMTLGSMTAGRGTSTGTPPAPATSESRAAGSTSTSPR